MNSSILSRQNLDSLYNFVNNDIKTETNIDLNSDRKYKNAIEKLGNNFYSKNKHINLFQLNKMVLDSVKPIILKSLHKNITDVLTLSQNSSINNQTLNGAPLNNEANFNVERNFNVMSRDKTQNKNILQNLQKLEAERDYNNLVSSSDSFSNKVDLAQKVSEQKLESVNKSRVDENNEFFKNLYDNKLNTKPPDFLQTPAAPLQRNLPNMNTSPDKGPPLINNPPTINYRNDKPEFEVSNIDVDHSISNLLKDQSTSNQIEFKEPSKNFNEIKESRENTKIEEISKNALDNFYQNDSYVFERRKKKVLTIDVSNYLNSVRSNTVIVDGDPVTSHTSAIINKTSGIYWSEFTVNFLETFKLDKIADVHLESITVNNPALATNFENLYMVIDIEEINIKTNTNNTFMKDKFVIPNENTSSAGGNKIMKYHLKSNYVATVNPTSLDRLTFKITNENNNTTSGVTATGVLINNAAGYNSGETPVAMTVDTVTATSKIGPGDILFNQLGQRLGEVTAVGSDTSITIGGGLGEFVADSENLYISSKASGVFVNLAGGYSANTTGEFDVDGVDANTPFNVGNIVYLSDNSRLGEITAIKGDGTGITIGGGTLKALRNDVQLYTAPPTTVFASNSPFNRIILELVFVTR
jgi:hypothetical protein